LKKKNAQIKFRNPYHDHPLMKKGGMHEKTEKAKRHAMKQKIKSEWYEQSI